MQKLLLTIAFVLTTHVSQAQSTQQVMNDLTAMQVAEQMAPGWNLGNTLEAGNNAYNYKNSGIGTETSWQPTKTSQAVIDYVKSLGFRSIRIPCAWVMGHISNASNYTIDPRWMGRVKEVVDYCINAGLYVILNDHWDGGWLENNIANNDASLKAKNHEVLKSIWTQIAETFKDYDEHLLFAGLNEPNADNQAATDNLLAYEQTFIDAVRATGGNNARRILVVQGPNTDIDMTNNYYKKLPNDIVENKLMMEVHYYTPWQFCGMTKDESWGKYMLYWGNENRVSGSQRNYANGEAEMERQFKKMKTKFIDKGIPVIIGEYGVNWKTVSGANESQEKHDASVKLYFKMLNKYTMQMGMVPYVWDINYTGHPTMTIINRKNCSIYANCMMDGIREAMDETLVEAINTSQEEADGTIYDISGRTILRNATTADLSQLNKGIYILNGKKHIVE